MTKHILGFIAALTWNIVISFVAFMMFYDVLSDVQTAAHVAMTITSLFGWAVSYSIGWLNLLTMVPWDLVLFSWWLSSE